MGDSGKLRFYHQKMAFLRYLALYSLLNGFSYVMCVGVKRNNDSKQNGLHREDIFDEEMASSVYWWESMKNPYAGENMPHQKTIEEEIFNDLNHIHTKEKRRIFDDLKKQKKMKFFGMTETNNISPLNIVELKAIQKSIKTPNSVFPTIRNKRTLDFLLFAVARAMGYTLMPRNPDVELAPVRSSPCRGPAPRPSPCAPPPSAPPPPPPPTPTIPPNQIDANTVRYPYRPSQQIPLLQFAPLPPGVDVPYPPLLQWPCDPTTPVPPSNPCAPLPKAPSACAPPQPQPPCGKPLPPIPKPHSSPSPPCSPPPAPPPPVLKNPAPCTPPPPPSPKTPPQCTPPPQPPKSPSPSPTTPKQPPQQPSKPPVTLEYDHPVRIQIFNNAKKFLPASGSVYSGNPSHQKSGKLEEYERLDEERREEDESEYPVSSNIFRGEEESSNEENYDDGHDEINMELLNGSRSRNEEDEEGIDDEKESIKSEKYYKRRTMSQPHRQMKSNPNLIDSSSKEQDYYASRRTDLPKKGVSKRVIKIRKPVTRHVDENGNEYTFARSAVHDIQKRDLLDFDFIRKYKESQGDTSEDEHYRDENPPGRTTTSIKKIEVKKFFVNKSEDDPVEYHEKNEHNHGDKPQKIEHIPDPVQHQEEQEEGGEDEKVNYRQFEPPEYEGRPDIEKVIQKELAREEEEEEEEEPTPRMVNYDPPPTSGKGVQYVTKTITKYVGGSGGKETVRVVPIYKVVHLPPPLPPRPPPVKKIIYHHHHRIPIYPKIIVRSGPTVKRRPAIVAGLTHPGNVLLVTIREKNG